MSFTAYHEIWWFYWLPWNIVVLLITMTYVRFYSLPWNRVVLLITMEYGGFTDYHDIWCFYWFDECDFMNLYFVRLQAKFVVCMLDVVVFEDLYPHE